MKKPRSSLNISESYRVDINVILLCKSLYPWVTKEQMRHMFLLNEDWSEWTQLCYTSFSSALGCRYWMQKKLVRKNWRMIWEQEDCRLAIEIGDHCHCSNVGKTMLPRRRLRPPETCCGSWNPFGQTKSQKSQRTQQGTKWRWMKFLVYYPTANSNLPMYILMPQGGHSTPWSWKHNGQGLGVSSVPRPCCSCHVVTGRRSAAPKQSGTTSATGTIATTSEGFLSSGLGQGWIRKTVWGKEAFQCSGGQSWHRNRLRKTQRLQRHTEASEDSEFVFKDKILCRRVILALQHGQTKCNTQSLCLDSYCSLLISWLLDWHFRIIRNECACAKGLVHFALLSMSGISHQVDSGYTCMWRDLGTPTPSDTGDDIHPYTCILVFPTLCLWNGVVQETFLAPTFRFLIVFDCEFGQWWGGFGWVERCRAPAEDLYNRR